MACVSLILNLVFYLAFPIIDGPVWCKDSNSYTSMECMREPFYPLFLKILRDVFGEERQMYGQPVYLFVAVLIQSAFAALAVWIVVRVIAGLGRSHRQRVQISVFSNLAFWGVQLLCRFAAIRGSAYPECIMTESFGMSFWILFVAAAFCYYRSHRLRYLALTMLLMFLCISLRKQLLVSAIVFGCMGLLYELILRKRWKLFLLVMVSCIVSMAGSTLFDYCYNYGLRGVWMQHTGNAMGIDCTLLYTTTAEDADLFTDTGTRGVFLAIQQQMEAQGIRYVDNPQDASWVSIASHYADAYDVIGYEIMNPVVDQYVLEQNPGTEMGSPQFYLLVDQVEEHLRDGLLHQNPSRFLHLWWFNICKGLVNTVLRMNTPLIGLAGILYALYIGLAIRLYYFSRRSHLSGPGKTKADAAPSMSAVSLQMAEEDGNSLFFASLVLLGVVMNAVVVGAIIFPQTRYMIYSMALFYSMGIVLALKNAELGSKAL